MYFFPPYQSFFLPLLFHLFNLTRHFHRWFMHQRLQPRMLLFFFFFFFFFFTLSFFICMPSHPLFVNPDRIIQDENSKKRIPTRPNWHGRYRRLVETIQSSFPTCLRWQSFVPRDTFHISRVYSVPCFFQTSRHATPCRKSNVDRKYVPI